MAYPQRHDWHWLVDSHGGRSDYDAALDAAYEAVPALLARIDALHEAIAAHRDAVGTGLLGKAEQDAADAHLWALLTPGGAA